MIEQVGYCPADYRQLPIDNNSVKLVLTDPLYHRKALPAWSEVAAWSAAKLAPDGCFLAYTGTYYLPEVLSLVGKHLHYQEMCVVNFQRPNKVWRGRSAWLKQTKCLVLASKSKDWKSKRLINTYQEQEYARPQHHQYQAPLEATLYYLERLTNQGDLVCDPFSGSWTTAVACQRLSRRFVGSDIDPKCREYWAARMAA